MIWLFMIHVLHLRAVECPCHVGSQSVTFHPTLTPIKQAGNLFTFPSGIKG